MHSRLVLLLLAVCLAVPATAAAVAIDDFSAAFPPNPDLPVSGRQIIFVGSTCDGSACPPGAIINHPVNDLAVQTGLSGVLGGHREGEIFAVAGTANSNIVPNTSLGNLLTFNHNAGASAVLELRYGIAADLDADLTLFASDAFEVSVLSGDMVSGPRPVPCTITVTSGRGTAAEVTASHTLDLVLEDSYFFFYTDFPGVDFTDVDRILYEFDASQVSAVDFAIGPLKTREQTVPVEATTWSRIKTLMTR
jgi:hypothetical protein